MSELELVERKKALDAQQDWLLRFVGLAMFFAFALWSWIVEQLVVLDLIWLAEVMENRFLITCVAIIGFIWLVAWRGHRRLRQAGLSCPNCSMHLIDWRGRLAVANGTCRRCGQALLGEATGASSGIQNELRQPSAMERRLGNATYFGALAGIVFSRLHEFSERSISQASSLVFSYEILFVLFGMICLFGLPAGIILGFLDRRRGTRSGWIAVVKVPAMIPLGYFLLVAVPALPLAVNVLARHGSEWLTGDADNLPARLAIGTLAGACFGMLLLPLLLISRKVTRWGANKATAESVRELGGATDGDDPV